jgi:predicted ABC-type ATPase
MDYLAAGPVEEHIRRVMNRAAIGGHSASERKLHDIYQHRTKNLLRAFKENRQQRIDLLRIFDNSENFGRPHLALSMFRGVPTNVAADVPAWLEAALEQSRFEIER